MRGEVIPVISMCVKLGVKSDDEYTKETRIIVLKLDQEGNVGFIVDEVKEVVSLADHEIEKITYDSKDEKANLIDAVGKHNGDLISLFDLSAITLEN
jgi:purine-binding chemotaxis protein CheW